MKDAEWLKIQRIRLGLKQEDVAKEMSTSKQTISNIESGRSKHKMTIAFYERIILDHLEKTPLRDIF